MIKPQDSLTPNAFSINVNVEGYKTGLRSDVSLSFSASPPPRTAWYLPETNDCGVLKIALWRESRQEPRTFPVEWHNAFVLKEIPQMSGWSA